MWEGLRDDLRMPEAEYCDATEKIRASIQACHQAGVRQDLKAITDILAERELSQLLSSNRELVASALRLYLELCPYLADRCLVFLVTDAQARILCLHSVPELIYRAVDIGLRLGASLAEESCGTNAVSLALRYARPTAVRSREHYCELFHGWFCVAAPIFNREGLMIGCAELCIDAHGRLGENLALVVMLAKLLATSSVSSDSIGNVPLKYKDKSPRLELSKLSTKQRTILELLMAGKTYKQIGTVLHLSTRTIESHTEKLRARYNARTTAHLITLALSGQTLLKKSANADAPVDLSSF